MNDTTKPDSNPSKPGVAAAGSKGKPTAAPAKPATPGSAKPAAAPPPAGKPAASGNRKRLIIAGVGIAAALAAVPAFNHFNKPAATSTAAPADIGPTVASGKIKDAPPPAPPEATAPSPVAPDAISPEEADKISSPPPPAPPPAPAVAPAPTQAPAAKPASPAPASSRGAR